MERIVQEKLAQEKMPAETDAQRALAQKSLLPEKLMQEKIERERMEKEASVSSLIQSVHESLAAADRQDYQTALTVLSSRFEAESHKDRMQRWPVLQDTHAKLFDALQSTTINKARVNQEAYKKWDEYIRQA